MPKTGMRPRVSGPLQVGPYAEQNPPGAVAWQGDPNAPIQTPGMGRAPVVKPPVVINLPEHHGGPKRPVPTPTPPAVPAPPPSPPGTVVLPEPTPPIQPTPIPTPMPTPTPGPALPTDVIGLLQAILLELRSTIQAGLTYSMATLIQGGVEPTHVLFDPPLFALNITCDGAGTIEYRLPDSSRSNWIALRPNETITYSSTRATWKSIGLRVPGAAATVRLVGQL